jgi:acyl-CoA synthetase (NDP forming)
MSDKKLISELDGIFHPRSVALLGASNKEGKIGRIFMERFVESGFQELYPVNPGESEVLGVRAYGSLLDIPGPVDLAIVITPTDAALNAVKDCAAKKVRGIVIAASGFGETGEAGKALEREMVRIARESGVRVIGPNCVGIYCPSSKLPFPLGPGQVPGSIGIVSQSGFFADFLTFTATRSGLTFSKAVSCGNEADLNATDILEYLGQDNETALIVAYIEGMRDGRRFHMVSKEISKHKPIILWKAGLTEAGARAALSHTGNLAGSGRVWEGALRQAGIVAVRSFEEVMDSLYAFHFQPLPHSARVAIISGPGGTAVGTTDMCFELGLQVPPLSDHTADRLRRTIPWVGSSVRNPVDLGFASLTAPYVYEEAIKILSEEEDVDMLLVIGVIGGEKFRDLILSALGQVKSKKPLVVTIMADSMQPTSEDVPLFLKSGISVYPDSIRAAKALARLWEYAKFRRRW